MMGVTCWPTLSEGGRGRAYQRLRRQEGMVLLAENVGLGICNWKYTTLDSSTIMESLLIAALRGTAVFTAAALRKLRVRPRRGLGVRAEGARRNDDTRERHPKMTASSRQACCPCLGEDPMMA